MSLRKRAMQEHPGFPWLEAADCGGVERYMRARGWLEAGEEVFRCEAAGEGNMNLTLRVETNRRTTVLKQARPWVEKYDYIPAPWDRAHGEIAFYRSIERLPDVREQMPRMLASDADSRTLLLEYIPGARDFSDLYGDESARLGNDEIDALAGFAARLHRRTRGGDGRGFANREMRALNHAHIYQIPLARDNEIDLELLEPGLARCAGELQNDVEYRACVEETGERYLADGPCLLHGDYFPGSWLRSTSGVRVIDPEFGYYGDPEVDVGCALAHFALARQPSEAARRFLDVYQTQARGFELEPQWLGRFAAVEVMRRLIGVAQLPLPESGASGFRAALLARSRTAMLEGDFTRLFGDDPSLSRTRFRSKADSA